MDGMAMHKLPQEMRFKVYNNLREILWLPELPGFKAQRLDLFLIFSKLKTGSARRLEVPNMKSKL